jgi:hypothetical protein
MAKHCWHKEYQHFDTSQSRFCCWCNLHQHQERSESTGHGPYLVNSDGPWKWPEKSDCPEREESE